MNDNYDFVDAPLVIQMLVALWNNVMSSFSLNTFAKHLKTHLFGLAYSQQGTHFWVCNNIL